MENDRVFSHRHQRSTHVGYRRTRRTGSTGILNTVQVRVVISRYERYDNLCNGRVRLRVEFLEIQGEQRL